VFVKPPYHEFDIIEESAVCISNMSPVARATVQRGERLYPCLGPPSQLYDTTVKYVVYHDRLHSNNVDVLWGGACTVEAAEFPT
jgi:hypothetical protein